MHVHIYIIHRYMYVHKYIHKYIHTHIYAREVGLPGRAPMSDACSLWTFCCAALSAAQHAWLFPSPPVHIYVYIYVCINMCICIFTGLCCHIHMNMWIHIYICMYIYIRMRTFKRLCCVCVQTWICMFAACTCARCAVLNHQQHHAKGRHNFPLQAFTYIYIYDIDVYICMRKFVCLCSVDVLPCCIVSSTTPISVSIPPYICMYIYIYVNMYVYICMRIHTCSKDQLRCGGTRNTNTSFVSINR
jgi:hypothetical protein